MIPDVQLFSWQQGKGQEQLQRVHTLFFLLPTLLHYHIFVYLFFYLQKYFFIISVFLYPFVIDCSLSVSSIVQFVYFNPYQ